MIYTVTFNPALDYVAKVDTLNMGGTNRSSDEYVLAGGKGLNVSAVLNNLGVENIAYGFIAGFTGKEIKRIVTENGCKSDFIELKSGMSRINVKLKSDNETEINGSGPVISEDELNELMKRFDKLSDKDILVLAGSIPTSLPDTVYMDILSRLDKGVTVVADATGKLLLNVLSYKPFLVKPNDYELGDLFGVNIAGDKNAVKKYALELRKMGARNVLVSMAQDGAVLVTEHGEVLEREAPSGNVKNSVGAGDSMIAGFLTGWIKTGDYVEAFRMGVAAGSASAFSDFLATGEQIHDVYNKLK